MAAAIRVFISSTYLDNAERRKRVEDAVLLAAARLTGAAPRSRGRRGVARANHVDSLDPNARPAILLTASKSWATSSSSSPSRPDPR